MTMSALYYKDYIGCQSNTESFKKNMLLTYKDLNGNAPAYFTELLIPHSPEHGTPIHKQCVTEGTSVKYKML